VGNELEELTEKNGKPNIAPLQPPTLATFRSWGSSAGAGRAGLPGAKIIYRAANKQAIKR